MSLLIDPGKLGMLGGSDLASSSGTVGTFVVYTALGIADTVQQLVLNASLKNQVVPPFVWNAVGTPIAV